MCVALFEPANTKVGTLKHIPRALTLGGHGHVSGVMWARIRPLGGSTLLRPCVPPSTCSAHSPVMGSPGGQGDGGSTPALGQ